MRCKSAHCNTDDSTVQLLLETLGQYSFVRSEIESLLKGKSIEEKRFRKLMVIVENEVGSRQVVKAMRSAMKKVIL
jgi:hypothetical protein